MTKRQIENAAAAKTARELIETRRVKYYQAVTMLTFACRVTRAAAEKLLDEAYKA